jgi:Leucine-rich repeat (LRR) protein
VLSLAYNNFNQLPQPLLDQSTNTLLYLSLAGNNFKHLDILRPALNHSKLLQLDLRNCGLKMIWEDFFKSLENLEHLYLSYNNIMTLQEFALNIPSLLVLDLSFNEEEEISDDTPNRMRIPELAFAKLTNLQLIDLSHTKLEIKSVASLTKLSSTVIGVSLCYSDLIFTGQRFLSNLIRIKYLDISGNPQLNFTRIMFNDISRSLERLDARDSNVRNLDWARPLTKLKIFNLKDNKIHELDNSSFSHMLDLQDLNLEKNSVGNWFTRLFTQNQELITLNLRENTLTQLSTEMVDDLLSVKFLALGRNKFECSCSLQEFMRALFESTKRTNITRLQNNLGKRKFF